MKRRFRMLQPLHIPKCCRQPRSRTARPPLREGSLVELSCKEGSSSSTTASMYPGREDPVSRHSGHSEEMPEFSLFRCSLSWNERQEGIILKSVEVPVIEVESVPITASLDSCKNRNTGPHSDDHDSDHFSAGPSPSAPDDSGLSAARNADAWLTPGNVVWAKTVYHEWWPAEVMDERVVRECTSSQHVGNVLVQLYGNHQFAWLDPVGDLSQFDHCYEERSKNPLTAFQDALKQALCKHVHTSPRILSGGYSGELKSSTHHDQSPDAWNTSSSSRTKDNCVEEGRGKRKRKLKIHFDELTFPEKQTRRLRRLRIMRHLGLAAPVGSPFSLTHGRSA